MTLWSTHPKRVALLLSAAMFAAAGDHWSLVVPRPLEQPFGVDFLLYRDAAARWLAGGSYFEPYQLAGPYPITAGDVLYPPVALWLFVPFTVLPAVLWWAVPIGVTAWAVWRLRPEPAWWPLIALCVAWPTTLLKTWTGNPVIWSVTALSFGVIYWWPSVFVLIKPSLFPFALFGANRRSWWIALAVFVAMCLPFGAMWGGVGDDAAELDGRRHPVLHPGGPDAAHPAGGLVRPLRPRPLKRPRTATPDAGRPHAIPNRDLIALPWDADPGRNLRSVPPNVPCALGRIPWRSSRWIVAIPPGC